jgi:D-3-phosphoglycerate dehydrogenase / 2-oxoglutarate reductase
VHILVPDNLDKAGLNLLKERSDITIQAAAKMSRDEVMAAIPAADALVVRSATRVDRAMLEAAPKLRLVGRAGVGVDNVDLDAATDRGVVVMNAPDGNTIATAELAFALMLALIRHVPAAQASLQEGQWDRKSFIGTELNGKTLGIIGFGRVGRAIAKRALAFDMTVLTYDPYISPEAPMAMGVAPVSLDDLYARADFITLHAVVTEENRHMINTASIAKMKPGVRIINAARGTLIDEAALAEAVKSGKVAGAGIDVYNEEPPEKGNALIGLPGVITTPHLGASTVEAQDAVAVQIAQQVLAALLKNEYKNVVNPAVMERIGQKK